MKSIRLAILLLLAPLVARAQSPVGASTSVTTEDGIMQVTTVTGPAAPHHPSRLFVKFRNGRRDFLPGSANERAFSHNADTFLIDTPPGLSVTAAVAQYQRNPNVEYAEPDYVVNIVATTPNDTQWANQWDMVKIAAPTMWDTQTSATSLVVAIIDTGVNDTHPDLIGNTLPGWNCIGAATINSGTGQPYGCVAGQIDDHGHGTHTAGTIGAVGNNNLGIAGINWQAKMMGFKFLDSGGSGNTSDAVYAFNKIAALKTAGTNIRVTNNSWGGGGFSQTLKDAMAAVEAQGIVNVCAAGNSGQNADVSPMYPGAYNNRGIVSVIATDSGDFGAGFTNFGAASTDIAAPGVSTLSTVPTGTCSLCDATGYKYLSGTSMASPHVAGAVAAMLQKNGALGAFMARDVLLDPASYDVMTDAKAKSTSTGGRLNLAKLLSNSKLLNPPAQLNNFPTITLGPNIFANGGQSVNVSATATDPDAADIPDLRISFGKSGVSNWLFGSMLYSLFPIPPAGSNSYGFNAPFVGRHAVETYLGSVSDNRGGGASGVQLVTVNPVASTFGGPDGTFSICQYLTANCANSGGAIAVTRNLATGYVDVAVNYNPIDPDNKGTPLWDSWYASYGGVGGNCCYSGTSMVRRFNSAGVWRLSVNSVDRYLETSPTTTAGRKTAIVRVDGATGTPPLAQLTADVVSGPAPLTVNFTMAGTQAFDGKTIQWYFMGCGEGFLYGKTTPTHQCVFNTPGTYWVEDLVADSAGLDDVVNLYIVVTPPNGGGGGDTTAPTVNITAPSAGAQVKGSINITADATDNTGGSGMKEVRFYLDTTATLLGTIPGSGSSFTLNNWNSAATSNGTHNILAIAYDNANNPSTQASVNILVDNAAPTTSFIAPTAANGATVSGATVAIAVSANDNAGGAGMGSVVLRLNNATSGSIIGTVNGAGPYNFASNTTALTNGSHTLYAIATDALGNSTTISRSFNVSNGLADLAVSVAIITLPVTRRATETIQATVTTDPSKTILRVEFYINNALVSTVTTPTTTNPNTYRYNWRVPNSAGKTYTIHAIAYDNTPRSQTSASISVAP